MIYATIFLALATLLGPSLPAIFRRVIDGLSYERNSRIRRRHLEGTWAGTGKPLIPPGQEGESAFRKAGYSIQLSLRLGHRRVKGEGHLSVEVDGKEHKQSFVIEGGFLADRFLRLEYSSKPPTLHFGSVTLEFDDASPGKLTGMLSGYGAFSRRAVAGFVELEKRDPP